MGSEQYLDDGQERPIVYASRTLSLSGRSYAQVELEALSIVYGVNKFHQFLYGRKFALVTDHKPLLAILGPKPQFPRWQLPVCSVGPSSFHHLTIRLNTVNLMNIVTAMRSPGCLMKILI